MNNELRCSYKLHGVIVEVGVVEIRCDSRFCGAGSDIVVLHRFDAGTGELIETRKYKRPHRKE